MEVTQSRMQAATKKVGVQRREVEWVVNIERLD
jgi:hypothetical protein